MGAVDEMMRVCVSQRGIVVMDVIWCRLCVSIMCEGDLFVLSRKRVQRVRRRSISSELIMCGGPMRSILLLPLVARCMYMAHVCFISVVVIVWGSVGMFVV